MHIPLWLVLILFIFVILMVLVADLITLKFFKIKLSRIQKTKLLLAQLGLIAVISLINQVLKNTPSGLLNILYIILGAAVWVYFINKFIDKEQPIARLISSYVFNYIAILILLVIGLIIVLASLIQTVKISGNSMYPALKANENVLTYKFDKKPSLSSIIIYKIPSGTHALGRVKGLPGQILELKNQPVELNGKLTYLKTYHLKNNEYYVTVDNSSYNIPARIINGSNIISTVGQKI